MKRYALNPSIQNFDGKVSFISIESLFEKTSELKSRARGNHVYVRMFILNTLSDVFEPNY